MSVDTVEKPVLEESTGAARKRPGEIRRFMLSLRRFSAILLFALLNFRASREDP
jgi:hypothetical protein